MIPVSQPSLSTVERDLILEAFDSGWVSSRGVFIETFEDEFARGHGVKHAVALSNGTVALHVALVAAGVRPGDEVVLPALTYVASAAAVRHCGAQPVFVDVSPATWCLDPQRVTEAITPKTRAVMSVDLYGYPADLDDLRAAVPREGVALVSDAAEGLGARRNGVLGATRADVATFSFFGNKVITSGEGGCLLTDDDEIARQARLLRNHGTEGPGRYNHVIIGYNYRLTNLQAALLVGQWRRLDYLFAARARVVERYEWLLADIEGIGLQPCEAEVVRSPWLAAVLIGEKGSALRNYVATGMAAAGVETRNFFVPLCDLLPYRAAQVVGGVSVSRDLSDRGLNLPTYADMDDATVDYVVETLTEILKRPPS